MKLTRYISCATIHSLVYLCITRQRGLAYATAVNPVSRYGCTKQVASPKMATSSEPALVLRQRSLYMYIDLRKALQTFALRQVSSRRDKGCGTGDRATTWNVYASNR